jgi:hypothetical protein
MSPTQIDNRIRSLISALHALAADSDRLARDLDQQIARVYAGQAAATARHAARMLGRLMDPDLRKPPDLGSPGQPLRPRRQL